MISWLDNLLTFYRDDDIDMAGDDMANPVLSGPTVPGAVVPLKSPPGTTDVHLFVSNISKLYHSWWNQLGIFLMSDVPILSANYLPLFPAKVVRVL